MFSQNQEEKQTSTNLYSAINSAHETVDSSKDQHAESDVCATEKDEICDDPGDVNKVNGQGQVQVQGQEQGKVYYSKL